MKSPFLNPMLGMGTFEPVGPPITTPPLPTCREDADPGDEQPPEPKREEFKAKALRRWKEQEQKAATGWDAEPCDLSGLLHSPSAIERLQENAKAFHLNRIKPSVTVSVGHVSELEEPCITASTGLYEAVAILRRRLEQASREYEAQVALSKSADSARQVARRLIEDQAIYGTGFTKVEVKATGSVEFRPTPMSEILAEAHASDGVSRVWSKFYTR